MQFESILAAVDMSPASTSVVSRAAMLAATHRVPLRVMNVSLLCEASRSPEALDLAALARQSAERFDVRAEVVPGCASSAASVAQQAGQRGLIVLKHERRLGLRSLWRGSLADQLLRIADSPVLVMKAESAFRERYDHVLVAVDLTPATSDLVRIACHLDERSSVQILHSIRPLHSNPLRDAEIPQRILQAYLSRRKLEAHEQLLDVAAAASKCRERVEVLLRDGEPARQAALQQSHRGADLVVVGKRRSAAFVDALFCGVAKRILAWCGGDILIVPYRTPCTVDQGGVTASHLSVDSLEFNAYASKEKRMNNGEHTKGTLHNPGVVSAEDPATGEPDPSVLKEVSEQASRGNMGPSKELAADTEMRRARLLGALTPGPKNSQRPEE